MKVLSGQAEEQDSDSAASQRRLGEFGAMPSPASTSGFGRRVTPIAEAADRLAPRAANDDGGAHMREVELGKSFGLQSVHDAPVVLDELSKGLLDWLQDELRHRKAIQHEAVLCALGALAGYAAQQAIRETLVKTGRLTLDQAFVVIETRSGEVFFFGDLLNEIIVARNGGKAGVRESGHASIWKIVSEAGYEAGAINLPDVIDIIKHCAATVGREDFGTPRLPDTHVPELTPREALGRFWFTTRRKLAGTEPMSWPLHLATAAHALIVALKDTIRPDIAVQIVMEAAVPMSKIDPVTLPKE